MQVTFLGTGSAMATPGRAQTGCLVESGGRHLLVDCGSGVLENLSRTETAPADVDAAVVTHHHTDHVADLVPLLKARWLAGADPLPVVGPSGTGDLLEGLLDVHDYLRGKVAYETRDVDAGTFEVEGVAVAAREATHSMPCLGYRFDDRFGVSGDTEADADLLALFEGCDALAHDCSFPDGVDVSNHPTPSSLGSVLGGRDVGTVYLTHLYPHTRGRETEMAETVRERYGGSVRVARDGLTVEV